MVGEFILLSIAAMAAGVSAGLIGFRLYRRRQSRTWLLPEVKDH